MSEPDWPGREAAMALIRRVNRLMWAAADAATPDGATRGRHDRESDVPGNTLNLAHVRSDNAVLVGDAFLAVRGKEEDAHRKSGSAEPNAMNSS